jgi:hypothetical protein
VNATPDWFIQGAGAPEPSASGAPALSDLGHCTPARLAGQAKSGRFAGF